MILAKWKESLEIFDKKELKTFILASLNTFKRSSLLFLKYFWWLLLLVVFFAPEKISLISSSKYAQYKNLSELIISVLFYSIISMFLFFFFTLCVRTSLENKDLRYFLKFTPKFLGFLFIWVLTLPLSILMAGSFATFFLLDCEDNFRSVFRSAWNGMKFSIYYLPVMLIFLLITAISGLFFYSLSLLIQNTFWVKIIQFLLEILNFLYLSFFSVFYTKMKHKDHNLFFKR